MRDVYTNPKERKAILPHASISILLVLHGTIPVFRRERETFFLTETFPVSGTERNDPYKRSNSQSVYRRGPERKARAIIIYVSEIVPFLLTCFNRKMSCEINSDCITLFIPSS